MQPNTTPLLAGARLTGGAPASGKVLAATDNLGNSEWTVGANVELAHAEISAAAAIATTMTDVPGLAITVAPCARPMMVEVNLGGVYGDNTGTFQVDLVRDLGRCGSCARNLRNLRRRWLPSAAGVKKASRCRHGARHVQGAGRLSGAATGHDQPLIVRRVDGGVR